MRYGRELTVDGQVRLTEVVEIPAGISDVAAWLAINLPHLSASGWLQVGADNVSGAVKQGSSYVNPPALIPAKAKTYTKAQFKEFCYGVLGTMAAPSGTADEKLAAGLAALGAINKALHASTEDAIYQVADEYDKADTFDKAKTVKLLGLLVPGIISAGQLNALSAAWQSD